ncbi:phosphoethanolamine transferase [Parvibaculum sp.]|uniref:phosphoethanolamine transferase n=1 Tax=Parvibaculum sp. TaxID=2024848 RepID=UPI0027302085|nr:phosphoethanolamine--lipid A transferase [Parvibaculum sp.]MDP1628527.1 phosphoethanolamine--lipid A transferase [Parvibaculum sp.]MDP2151859.1 phosphoethanolamine--lipid A transferase [Parvibaculum sp.]MDP3326982.1 phosphoethanolamine--lipid A transferase [Parvibaculum sp.]
MLALAVSAALVLFYNGQLWAAVLAAAPGRSFHDLAFLASVGLFLVIAFNLILQPFALPRILKPVLILLVLIAASVSYFASSYGAVMDKTMIANVIETDTREVGDLLSIRLFSDIALFGVLPAIVIWRVPLVLPSWRKEAAIRAGIVVGSFVLVGLTAATFYQDYAMLLRNHREVRLMVNPSAAIYASMRYATEVPGSMTSRFERVAANVTRAPAHGDGKKTVMVFVVGETARADHFSLNGYERETNPELSKLGVVSFGEVRSCGTSTAESVPCMFSDLARADYSAAAAGSRENMLDILARAGVDVLWLENNSSCKGVCARVPSETMWEPGDTEFCNGGECRDDILLQRLREALAKADNDTIVVLHQIGSHGPSYYKRFTEPYRVFAPTCDTNELQSCTPSEIVNSYDDSILYTDRILARTVGILDGVSDRFDTAMIYASDHGESLGENGIYLHGMPYMFAPDAQKHVPMLVWTSEGYREKISLDTACLAAESGNAFSHDNLFHSVLGGFDVRTDVYKPELDFLAPCRSGVAVAHATEPVIDIGRP